MVLPGGIEPPASPLPRECSTPELRQQPCRAIAISDVRNRGESATAPPVAQAFKMHSLADLKSPQKSVLVDS